MTQKSKKRKRRRDQDIDTSSGRSRSSSSPPVLKKRNTAAPKRGDTDGADHKDRRAKRAERTTSVTGRRKRSNTISTTRTNRDSSGTLSSSTPVTRRQRSNAITESNTGRQRSAAITSRTDARGPDRRDLRTRPITEASDGTALWDGSTAPELSDSIVKDVLKDQKPKYDIGKGRMVYPTETAPGVIEYLPLARDASENEIDKGIFVSIVPEQSLTDFAKEKLTSKRYEVEGGAIEAVSVADVKKAFEAENNFVLRSQRYLDSIAQSNESLQQKWTS